MCDCYCIHTFMYVLILWQHSVLCVCVCVCVCVWERESMWVGGCACMHMCRCVCVCVRERERDGVCVCVWIGAIRTISFVLNNVLGSNVIHFFLSKCALYLWWTIIYTHTVTNIYMHIIDRERIAVQACPGFKTCHSKFSLFCCLHITDRYVLDLVYQKECITI